MKNKLDTLQMVMLGYLMSIMAAFYNLTKEQSWFAKERTGTKKKKKMSYCDDGMSPGLRSVVWVTVKGQRWGGARGAGAFCSGFVVALTPSDSEKVCLKCNDNTRSKLLPFSIAQQEGNGLVK